jgi:Zn-dependent membrane protease YugP
VLREPALSGPFIPRPRAAAGPTMTTPGDRTLNLPADIGDSTSAATLGVAAHEAGHAAQHARRHWPTQVRQTLVPAP